MSIYLERERPYTVTRGLPHYQIGKDYQRLLRLNREYDHMQRWHSFEARSMIQAQCEALHYRVYRVDCSYGGGDQ